MSGIQMKSKPHRVDNKPIPGCLGRMVNLFDLASTKNRLLTDKPHNDGSTLSRSRSDVSRMSTTVGNELLDDEVSELKSSSLSKTAHGTPVKMLLAQDMSKDLESRQNSPNLVAKLMGLDVLPQQLPDSATRRSHSHSQWHSQNSHADNYWQDEQGLFPEHSDFEDHPSQDESDFKDIYEIWEQSQTKNCISCNENVTDKKLAFIRQKFMEAKRLATDEKLRQSEEFQDALSVLSANGDLFLKVLQEPNSLISQNHLYGVRSIPSSPDAKLITVLRPSAMVVSDKHPTPTSRIEKVAKKQLLQVDLWDNHKKLPPTMSMWKANDSPAQPTRIVLLKPSLAKVNDAKAVISSTPSTPRTQPREGRFFADPEDKEAHEARGVAKEITQQMQENLTGHRRDETLLSSVLSNGYTGDESSCDKSESEFAMGCLSDSEVMSPTTSRHSWDYGIRHGSPCSVSSFTRVSHSPESSVSREAKRRLSERWAMIASNGRNQEQKSMKKSSSTLGEMLALFEGNEPEMCKEAGGSGDASPRSLLRSKSLPVSSTVYRERLNPEVSKTKTTKSFTGKVTSLFFSRNKKEKPKKPKSNDESQSATVDSPCSLALSGRISSDQSEVICSQQEGLWLSQSATRGIQGENPDQPSPISVLDPPSFEEDDSCTLGSSSRSIQQNTYGRFLSKSNLIDKSPLIGSIARTLSWDESHAETASPYPYNSPLVSTLTKDDDEWHSMVQSLLTMAGLNNNISSNMSKFHSPESPLDPTLKDRFIDQTNNKELIMHGARRRKLRSTRRLVFDIVNATLVDMTDVRRSLSGPHKHELTRVEDEVWARAKEWVLVKGDSSALVEWEVWKEVVGKGWAHQMGVEVDNIGKEIEGMLLQELVEESLLLWRTT